MKNNDEFLFCKTNFSCNILPNRNIFQISIGLGMQTQVQVPIQILSNSVQSATQTSAPSDVQASQATFDLFVLFFVGFSMLIFLAEIPTNQKIVIQHARTMWNLPFPGARSQQFPFFSITFLQILTRNSII